MKTTIIDRRFVVSAVNLAISGQSHLDAEEVIASIPTAERLTKREWHRAILEATCLDSSSDLIVETAHRLSLEAELEAFKNSSNAMRCALEVAEFLASNDESEFGPIGLREGLSIYVDGARYHVTEDGSLKLDIKCSPREYLEWCGDFLSMSFEGGLYDCFEYEPDSKIVEGLESIFAKYGKYYEQGNAWNLSLYDID